MSTAPTFTTSFIAGAVPSIQYILLSLSSYVSENITTSNIESQQAVLQAIQQTLINMIDLINAFEIQFLMAQEYSNIVDVASVNISAPDLVLVNNRLSSFQSLVNTIYPLPFVITFNINNLDSGLPAIPPYDLISYFVTFNYETAPVGLTVNNFFTNAQAMATAWSDVLTTLTMSATTSQLPSINPVDRMSNCSQDTTNFVENYTLAADLTSDQLTQAWNSTVALPSLLRVASVLYNDPSSQNSQSINALKYAIFNLILQTNGVLAAFNVPNNLQQPITSQLRTGESLLDFAARTTGDYTQWEAIAAANNLQPPYISATPGPNVAVPGQKLFLPPFSISSAIGDYADAYLGTDFNFGLPYGQMPPWTGDFNLISGVNNYVGALARRVLTTQGALIYHTQYGSLLPPQIGQVQTSNEAILLSSYLKSALLSDPRTQIVNRITAYPANFGQIIMTALVTPFGASSPAPFNLVVVPRGAAITSS